MNLKTAVNVQRCKSEQTNGVILAERLFLGLTFAFPVQSYLTSCPIGRATDIHSVDRSAYRSEVIKL